MIQWCWPLPNVPKLLPDTPGRFGAVRKHDVHTGVDLYCAVSTKVVAVEAGEVVVIEPFTGPDAASPWWLSTEAVLVEGASGVVVYGEVHPEVQVGDQLEAGDRVGRVMRVLPEDKGRPTSMLHLELMVAGARTTVWWLLDKPQPPALRDPTPYLEGSR
jgi:murein DD-endopeptidase MepM/ murein hydrolase activator NlpD